MSNPFIKIHNIETNEIIEREMDAEEFVQWKIDQAKSKELQELNAAKTSQKVALLAKLGITEEEAQLLLS